MGRVSDLDFEARSSVLPGKVVAIVLNWNLPRETFACIESLLSSDYPDLQVIVVDNGSTDGSPDLIRTRFPGIEVLALPENRGYAAGNNVGIVRALSLGAEWVLIVNNDAIVAADTISNLVVETRSRAGIAMPRIDAWPSGGLWRAGARVSGLYPLPRSIREGELAVGKPISIDYAIGCVLLIHRTVLERIGLFDEGYFMYYEDLDFSARARTAGIPIIVVPSARAWHKIGTSLKANSPRRTYLQTRYRTRWCRAQKPSFRTLVWWIALMVGALRSVVGSAFHASWLEVAATVRGLHDGMTAPNGESRPEARLALNDQRQ